MLKNKKRTLVTGLVIVLVGLMSNIWYYQAQKIDEPIVLKHYYETSLRQGDNGFEIFYITNLRDQTKILSVYFPKYDLQLYVQHSQINQYKYYNLKSDYMTFRLYEDPKKDNNIEKMILDEAVVTFNNGTKQTINIGKIIVDRGKDSGHLDSTMSSSSSSGESKVVYKVYKDITINQITTDLYEESKGLVKMVMYSNHGRDYTLSNLESEERMEEMGRHDKKNKENISYVPLEEIQLPFKATKSLEVCTYIPTPEDERKFNVYDLRYTLHFEDANGDEGIEYIWNMDYRPFFTDRSLKRFIKSRGK